MWTKFMDMYSGGSLKEKWEYIYIEAPQKEAELIFYNRFGHNPNRVSCTCCGNDYSISESESLEESTGYDHCTLDKYCKRKDVLIIPKSKIKPEWRIGDIPQQGYVWID